jgi:hypothetical protein
MTLQQIAGFIVDAADWRACVFLAIAAVVFAALNVWQWRERRRLTAQWLYALDLMTDADRENDRLRLDPSRPAQTTETCPNCGLTFCTDPDGLTAGVILRPGESMTFRGVLRPVERER